MLDILHHAAQLAAEQNKNCKIMLGEEFDQEENGHEGNLKHKFHIHKQQTSYSPCWSLVSCRSCKT
jgi:hypothetical protein